MALCGRARTSYTSLSTASSLLKYEAIVEAYHAKIYKPPPEPLDPLLSMHNKRIAQGAGKVFHCKETFELIVAIFCIRKCLKTYAQCRDVQRESVPPVFG